VEWQRRAESRREQILKIVSFALYAVLLLHSDSVTPLIALFGGLLIVESYKFATFKLRLPVYAFFVAVSGALLVGVAFVISNSDSVMAVVGRSSNLTGRTEIWSLVFSFIPERAILGYGHAGFWLGASPESFVINRIMRGWVMYSHNGYLEMLLNLGIVGLTLTLIFLAVGMKRAINFSRNSHTSAALWPMAFLFYFILHNLGECTIMIQDIEWSLCVACVVGSDPLLSLFNVQEDEPEMALVPIEEGT